ncbi:MAG TPA: TonB-dependent receptor [Caulobacteraceae bacterium]|nr:TonB-dependent receptor [Caulobacteraceae bacterium]
MLGCGVALAGLIFATSAAAQDRAFELPSEDAALAIPEFARQADIQILAPVGQLHGVKTPAVRGRLDIRTALAVLLAGTGLEVASDNGSVITLRRSGAPVHKTDGADETSSPPVADDVVVTGSHIRGAPNIGIHVDTVTRQDIENSGYPTVAALVASIPQNFADVSPEGVQTTGGRPEGLAQSDSDFATAIDLRGLGAQSTLTLLDGQRVAGSEIGRVVDVSTIPLAIVDHVDVLTDANSAIYGSDAVGGVVNFVLRHQYDGAQTDAYVGASNHGGYLDDISQIFGKTYDRGGFLISYDYTHDTSFDLVKAGLTAPSIYGQVPVAQPLGPDTTRHSLYATGQFDVNSNVKLYAEGSYVWRTSKDFQLSDYPAYGFDASNNINIDTQIYNVIAGAKVALPDEWRLDLSGSTSGNRVSNHTIVTESGSFSYYSDQAYLERSSVSSISANFDGPAPLFGLAGKAAVGFEARRETLNAVGLGASNAERWVEALYGEYRLPILSGEPGSIPGKLDVSLSGRYENYTSFGQSFSPQGGIRWQPVDGVVIRGAAGTAFRVPDFLALYQPVEDIISPSTVCSAGSCPTLPVLTVAGGNPTLRPETATTESVRLEIDPPQATWLHLAISYFNIDYKNRITTPIESYPPDASQYPDQIFLNPTAEQGDKYLGAAPPGAIYNYTGTSFTPTGQGLLNAFPNLAIEDNRFANVAIEHVDGIDFSGRAEFALDSGIYSASLNGTYTLNHSAKATAASSAVSLIDGIGYPAALRLRGQMGWTGGPLNANVFVNYTGSYPDQFTVPVSTMPSWTTVDLTLAVDGSKLSGLPHLKGWRAIISVQNLFDQAPPYFKMNHGGLVYDAANATGLGRFASLRLSKAW